MLLCAIALTAGLSSGSVARAETPERYAGTYRIAEWRTLQERGLYHFFYLHPDGRFLLQAAWARHERSRFVGRWSVGEDRLHLNGQGSVETNQGSWRTDFSRTYRIRVDQAGFVLEPELLKNRYGLLGWPNAFHFFRRQPVPNVPEAEVPADAAAMARHLDKLQEPAAR